jgi:hypothetical protein
MPKTFETIANTTLSSGATTVTLSSIPQTYTDLKLVIYAFTNSEGVNVSLRFNSDTTSTNYPYGAIYNVGSFLSTSSSIGSRVAFLTPSSAIPFMTVVDILSYTSSGTKPYLSKASQARATGGFATRFTGTYLGGSGISSITLLNDSAINFNTGTSMCLYGIKEFS